MDRNNTHRLIPTRYSENGRSVLSRLSDDDDELRDLFAIEGATNERLLGEANLLPGISVHELVFGTPNFHIVNASFTHAHPEGGRFNGPDRGAWYAGFTLTTSQAEVAFHYAEYLREIDWPEPETVDYRDYLADFRAAFHDLRRAPEYRDCLDPHSYVASQKLARELLDAGSAGVVFPSVRYSRGTCIACFRPALVTNVREGPLCTFTFSHANQKPTVRVSQPGA